MLFDELHSHAAGGEAADGGAQVVEVPSKAVRGVDEHGAAVAYEREQYLELGSV